MELTTKLLRCVLSLAVLATGTLLLYTFTAHVGHKSSLYASLGVFSGVHNGRKAAGLYSEGVTRDMSKSSGKMGYVLSLRYSGQQGAGIAAMLSQLCWIGSFDLPMRLVEPYIRNNALVGLPLVNQTHDQVLRIGDFFDLNNLINSVRDRGYGVLSRIEEFEREAPRNLILIQMVGGKINYTVNILWESGLENLECMRNTSSPMNYFKSNQFCVVKIIEIIFRFGTSFVFTADDMHHKIFGHWKPEGVTLVFSLWRAPWFVENIELVNPAMCHRAPSHGLQSVLHPSERLLEDAQKYEDLFLRSGNRLSVMMRVEHSVTMLGRVTERSSQRNSTPHFDISQCFRKLQNTTRALQKAHNYSDIFLTTDIGKYASTTWNQTFRHYDDTSNEAKRLFTLVESIICYLLSNKTSFEEWENSFSKVLCGRESAGYVAALQRTIASRSDCLVLLGGGTFQRLALHDHMQNHPNLKKLCVYFVCLDGSFIKEFNEITSGKAITVRP